MQNSQIVALIAVAISIVSIGLLFAVHLSLQSDLRILNNNMAMQSEQIRSLTSEVRAVQQIVEDQKTTILLMQSDLDKINATLIKDSDEIKTLTQLTNELQEKMVLIENKIKSLEDRIALLKPEPLEDKSKIHLPSGLHGKVIWYGPSFQDFSQSQVNNATIRLQSSGVDVEIRARPVSNLGDAKLVVIMAQFNAQFSTAEVIALKNYVNNGGRLILTADTDYSYCSPASLCAMEIARNFGFAFAGVVSGTITPAEGQTTHPIWTTPNHLSSSSSWCCDAYVGEILDPANVEVLARIYSASAGTLEGSETSKYDINNAIAEPETSTVPAIVVNENPAFNGGKVMGVGYNMFVGLNGDFRLFDNITTFMLQG